MAATPRQSAMQRLKVGIFCLALVLILVSITNVMLERNSEIVDPASVSEEPDLVIAEDDDVPEDPLAEMGATPSVEPESEKEDEEALPDPELDGPNTTTVE